ncbi:hypothetical protein H671_8g19654 [Cricetulus griseus]|nr:hypothetical protein H671_8g19654 [Cricetulus griseus]
MWYGGEAGRAAQTDSTFFVKEETEELQALSLTFKYEDSSSSTASPDWAVAHRLGHDLPLGYAHRKYLCQNDPDLSPMGSVKRLVGVEYEIKLALNQKLTLNRQSGISSNSGKADFGVFVGFMLSIEFSDKEFIPLDAQGRGKGTEHLATLMSTAFTNM